MVRKIGPAIPSIPTRPRQTPNHLIKTPATGGKKADPVTEVPVPPAFVYHPPSSKPTPQPTYTNPKKTPPK